MASWEGVNEFVAVVEAGSFTGAAKKLDTSVVHVSRKVAALEERLAIKLLYRTTRKVSYTEAGNLFYEQCKHLVEGLELAEQAVSEIQSTPKGGLKVTAPATFGEQYIAPLINQFLVTYPQLDIDLVLTNQQLDLIENRVDVAVRLGHLKDSSFKAKILGYRQLCVCASPQYLNDNGTPKNLADLAQHECLLGTQEFWHFKEGKRSRSFSVSGRLRCNSGLSLLDAAKRGLGLVQLPHYYIDNALASGELREVLYEYRSEKEGIWAIYPHASNISLKVRLLTDFLADHLSINPVDK